MNNETVLPEKRYVGVKETVLYGVANGGQVIGYNLVRMQLTFFLLTVFGLPSKAVAIMIFVLGIWDALNDPIMGSIVDRTRTRFGKLRPYLLFVPIPLGIATVFLFGGAEFLKGVESDTVKVIYTWIVYFIWELFYTIGDIPFWGLSAAISPSLKDRSNAITSARFISGIIGGGSNLLIPIFIDLSRNNVISWNLSQVFLFMGLLAGTVGMVLFSFAGLFTRERVVQSNEEPKLLDSFRFLFKNKPLLLIVLSNVLGTVSGVGDMFTQYFYTLSLGIASLSIVAEIPGIIMSFLAYSIIPTLEKHWSSKKIVIGIPIIKAIITTIIFFCGMNSYTNAKIIVPLLAIQGVFTSAISSVNAVIPTKMIGDTVDYMEVKTGERSEGMAFSLLTFISKLTGSFATGISAIIFPLIGLEQVDSEMRLAANSTINTKFWLWGFVTMIPQLLNLISVIPMFFYDLEGKKLDDIHKKVAEHRMLRSKEMTEKHTEENENG